MKKKIYLGSLYSSFYSGFVKFLWVNFGLSRTSMSPVFGLQGKWHFRKWHWVRLKGRRFLQSSMLIWGRISGQELACCPQLLQLVILVILYNNVFVIIYKIFISHRKWNHPCTHYPNLTNVNIFPYVFLNFLFL